MRDYDVIIIGAGPAGSYSALCCAKEGLKTLLLDRQLFPRDKPCGGILESKYIDRLTPFLKGFEENITYHTSIYYDYQKLLICPIKSYIFKRIKLDQLLVNLAIKEGVEFRDDAKIVTLNQNGNFIKIKWNCNGNGNNGVTISKAKLCIGADGVNSMVRRASGLERFRQKPDKLVSMVIEEAKPRDDRAFVATTEFGKPAIASYFFSGFAGFAWLAPAKDTINVGIGLPITEVRKLKSKFIEFLEHLGLEHEFKNAKTHTIPFMPLKQIYSGRVMLVGDAAGTVNPWTGGGIILGLKSAKNAARAAFEILKTKNNKNLSPDIYQEHMKNTMKILQIKGKLVKFSVWCFQHKLTSPQWERFIIKHITPHI